jgi:hypothetical protein
MAEMRERETAKRKQASRDLGGGIVIAALIVAAIVLVVC